MDEDGREPASNREEGQNAGEGHSSDLGPVGLFPDSRVTLSFATSFSSPGGEGNHGIHLTRLLHGEAELISV